MSDIAKPKKEVKLMIAGLGNVGKDLLSILTSEQFLAKDKLDYKFKIQRVSSKTPKDWLSPDIEFVQGAENLLQYSDYDILIELIGTSPGVSYDLIKDAILKGKNVVTANKALIANHGNELITLAEKHSVSLYFEAAVAGAIPILKVLREALASDCPVEITGLLNGTSNYILSQMKANNLEFEEALKQAQELGYAETDPTFDIEGIDAAHKISILSSIAYHTPINFQEITPESITTITAQDIKYAQQLNYTIKSLAFSYIDNDKIIYGVDNFFIEQSQLLSQIDGSLNAVQINSQYAGSSVLIGSGAGGIPTSSAILSNLHDIMNDSHYHSLGFPLSKIIKTDKQYLNHQLKSYRFYIKLTIQDPTQQEEIINQVNQHIGSISLEDENNIIIITEKSYQKQELLTLIENNLTHKYQTLYSIIAIY